jgi:hypothetical protein
VNESIHSKVTFQELLRLLDASAEIEVNEKNYTGSANEMQVLSACRRKSSKANTQRLLEPATRVGEEVAPAA